MTPEESRAVLGVGHNAGFEEIKRVYRKRAKRLHPDLNRSDSAVHEFATLNQAYTALVGGPQKQGAAYREAVAEIEAQREELEEKAVNEFRRTASSARSEGRRQRLVRRYCHSIAAVMVVAVISIGSVHAVYPGGASGLYADATDPAGGGLKPIQVPNLESKVDSAKAWLSGLFNKTGPQATATPVEIPASLGGERQEASTASNERREL